MPHGTVIPHYRVTDIGIENPVVVATVIFAGIAGEAIKAVTIHDGSSLFQFCLLWV